MFRLILARVMAQVRQAGQYTHTQHSFLWLLKRGKMTKVKEEMRRGFFFLKKREGVVLSPFSLALFDNNKTFLFSLASCTSPPQTSSSSPSSSCWRRPFFLVRCPLSTRVRDGIQPTEMLKFHFNSFLFLLFLKKKQTKKQKKPAAQKEEAARRVLFASSLI